jgi:hypothetical protein
VTQAALTSAEASAASVRMARSGRAASAMANRNLQMKSFKGYLVSGACKQGLL